METLVQRLVQNPHDQAAITYAHQQGQSDPSSYAQLLEKVGIATTDPAFSSHWLTEAANVWTTTLGDAHRAARALMTAIDRAPTQSAPAERLAELYREKGDVRALVAMLERRGKALGPLAAQDAQLRPQVAAIYEELGRLWMEPPLSQTAKSIEYYRLATEYDPNNAYSVYALRELYKSAGQFAEAVPYFEMEQRLIDDPERQLALYEDEAEVRRSAGDLAGASEALRRARAVEGGQDAGLKQMYATSVLDRVQAQQAVGPEERAEGAALFVELAEEYQGEHGYSYSACALELDPTNDRAVQLLIYYSGLLNQEADAAPRVAEYLRANPQGPMVNEARELVNRVVESGVGDEAMLLALAPPPGAEAEERISALLDVAQALARKAKKGEAATRYKEILELDPGNEDAINFLEGYLRQTRKYAVLRDILFNASRAGSADEDQRIKWLKEAAQLCETQLRDGAAAVSAWQRVLAMDPSDEGAVQQLKRLFERARRWDDLAALLQKQAEQMDDIEARISLEKQVAKIHEQRRKDPVASGSAWARIADLTPEDEAAISTAVGFFEKGARPDLAAQVIADNIAGIDDESTKAELYRKLGELREASGDANGAGDAFAEAAVTAKSAQLWEAAERCYVQAQAWSQAASAVEARADLSERDSDKAGLFAREASYLRAGGDEAGALSRLEQATDLDPGNTEYAGQLEAIYEASQRIGDLAALLLRRAERISDKTLRIGLRKRAAVIMRDKLNDLEGARSSFSDALQDGEDPEALAWLADDAERTEDYMMTVEFLDRLARAMAADEDRAREIQLRAARVVAEKLDDPAGAIERHEQIVESTGGQHTESLKVIADLHERNDNPKGAADALERWLKITTEKDVRIEVSRRLGELYEGPLDDPRAAVRNLEIVAELDPEDFDVIGRLCTLSERLEDWQGFVKHQAALIEIEGDEDELSRMTRRLAEVYHAELGQGDEALAALLAVADTGDEPCREAYVELADELGWKGIVAAKLVEWNAESPVGPERNAALRGAFERFIEVGREADAANVAKELARTKGADPELAVKLEEIAVKLKDLDALGIAHDLQVLELTGPARAEEMVRQAEVMVSAGVDRAEAIQHGEQALTSVSPEDVEPLLSRLAELAEDPEQVVELYQRQVTRCKSPSDRLRALARAAQVAAEKGALDRARSFLDIALGGGVQQETLEVLEEVARKTDAETGNDRLRRTLAEALAAGGQGSRDGGRTRGTLLARAATIAMRDLRDHERAFLWLGDSLVAHVDDESLDLLDEFSGLLNDPKRAEKVLGRALDEVFDGPLVRKLLARRADLREQKLDDLKGAAEDLKRLHDLSPSDTTVMEQLSDLYTRLGDYRGMVALYEDQILRGKDQDARAELARKVARIWESQLDDPHEAADAWRRVLRMKSGDAEAKAGLGRAKANMLQSSKSESSSPEAAAESGLSAVDEAIEAVHEVEAESNAPEAVAEVVSAGETGEQAAASGETAIGEEPAAEETAAGDEPDPDAGSFEQSEGDAAEPAIGAMADELEPETQIPPPRREWAKSDPDDGTEALDVAGGTPSLEQASLEQLGVPQDSPLSPPEAMAEPGRSVPPPLPAASGASSPFPTPEEPEAASGKSPPLPRVGRPPPPPRAAGSSARPPPPPPSGRRPPPPPSRRPPAPPEAIPITVDEGDDELVVGDDELIE